MSIPDTPTRYVAAADPEGVTLTLPVPVTTLRLSWADLCDFKLAVELETVQTSRSLDLGPDAPAFEVGGEAGAVADGYPITERAG